MDTHVRTPQAIFIQPQHLVVPRFQRPYVWEQEEQWVPLWQDVRRLVALRSAQTTASATHFLGAIVIQAQDPMVGDLQAFSIIDGQQRLTTLQLLMDATAAVLESRGHDALAAQLDRLTHNEAMYMPDAPTTLKLRHSNKDRGAFDEVMDADAPVSHDALEHGASRIVRAHAYFCEAVAAWLEDGHSESTRAEALTSTLTVGLKLVAIDLTASEDSQEIFETLNARGTPLTASDLIRNFVFQRLAADGADTSTYLEAWPFETEFWEKPVTVGRYPMQRSSLFFNQWLIARIGEEISPRSTFSRFKQYVEHLGATGQQPIAELLPVIREQADNYEAWTVAAEDPDKQLNRVELAIYRSAAAETEVLKPLLIWLHEPARAIPADQIELVVATAESWLVRRQLLRLNNGDLGRVVADIIKTHSDTPTEDLAASVERYLTRLNVTSTYWPGDAEVRAGLQDEQAYRRFIRRRLRMFLEAIEDRYREATNQPQAPRRGYPIEHILPQKWKDNWPVSGPEEEIDRSEHLHRLGNLTLLTTPLNSKVSNGPWEEKREGLAKHDTLLLNSQLLSTAPEAWDESRIDSRTAMLTDELLALWPVPQGHTGEVVDPHEKSGGWITPKNLVEVGLLAPGTVLQPREGSWEPRTALVREDGLLEVDGQTFEWPSGAGKAVKGSSTNGWTFWRLPDGRKLADLKAEYEGKDPDEAGKSGFDWSALHTILEALPEGHWTTYGSLADAVGTAPQPLGNHVATCRQCANAYRILTTDGSIAPGFRWTDPTDKRDPAGVLRAEGAFLGDRPDPARGLDSDQLQALIEE